MAVRVRQTESSKPSAPSKASFQNLRRINGLPVSPVARLLASQIAGYERNCYREWKTFADELDVSLATIKRAARELTNIGILVQQDRDARKRNTLKWIDLDRLKDKSLPITDIATRRPAPDIKPRQVAQDAPRLAAVDTRPSACPELFKAYVEACRASDRKLTGNEPELQPWTSHSTMRKAAMVEKMIDGDYKLFSRIVKEVMANRDGTKWKRKPKLVSIGGKGDRHRPATNESKSFDRSVDMSGHLIPDIGFFSMQWGAMTEDYGSQSMEYVSKLYIRADGSRTLDRTLEGK